MGCFYAGELTCWAIMLIAMSKLAIKITWPYAAILAFIVLVSLTLQLHNISRYNIYPDSYQSVTVAKNLKTYHRLTAPMGPNGLVYPDFFGWTRPLYPVLIVFFSLFGFSLFSSAHLVAMLAGLISTITIYVLATSVFKSPKYGIVASALLAVSYNHAIWGGFILTETLGILMLSLALWSLWRGKDKKAGWFDNQDILTGVLFAAAILARYEYLVLLIPAAFLVGKKRALSICVTSILIVVIVLAILHPFSGGFEWAWGQVKDYVKLLLGVIETIVVGQFVLKRQKKRLPAIENWAAKFLVALLVLAGLALIFARSIYPGLWRFAANDPLLTYSAFAGLILLLLGKKPQRRLGFLLFSGLLILGAVYYHINPQMDRYVTHLLPVLLIAASYGIAQLVSFQPGRYMTALIGLFIFMQFIKSWIGLHHAENGIWFKPGYEQKSAKILSTKISGHDFLITSMPEPYYLFTGNPTQSVADSPPYIFANIPKNTKLTIVDDEAMRVVFPRFNAFVQKNLSSYQTAQYSVGEPLRYVTTISQEQKPVTVYKITYGQLQKLLDKQTANR
jgi:hypothetical protein